MEYLDLAGVLLIVVVALGIKLARRKRRRRGADLVRRMQEENGHG